MNVPMHAHACDLLRREELKRQLVVQANIEVSDVLGDDDALLDAVKYELCAMCSV